MTIDTWLEAAIADAERRGLPELKPLLEAFAQATRALRAADFNENHEYVAPSVNGGETSQRNRPT